MSSSYDNLAASSPDLVSVDFVADAHEAAVLRIADILRHPDDLTSKLGLLRKKVAMERASVEAQLKTVMESQLDGTQKGIDALRACRAETSKIREALQNMDKLCGDPQNSIKNYAHIKRVSFLKSYRPAQLQRAEKGRTPIQKLTPQPNPSLSLWTNYRSHEHTKTFWQQR
eukprot:jgi/Hompol1/6425/HPOL_002154-RA